jgi:hypothetical protein
MLLRIKPRLLCAPMLLAISVGVAGCANIEFSPAPPLKVAKEPANTIVVIKNASKTERVVFTKNNTEALPFRLRKAPETTCAKELSALEDCEDALTTTELGKKGTLLVEFENIGLYRYALES